MCSPSLGKSGSVIKTFLGRFAKNGARRTQPWVLVKSRLPRLIAGQFHLRLDHPNCILFR